MKKKRFLKEFSSEKAMDQYLQKHDLGELFQKFGEVKTPSLKKINLDLPEWLVKQLDYEAARAGVSRQPLIKIWLIEKLEEEHRKRAA